MHINTKSRMAELTDGKQHQRESVRLLAQNDYDNEVVNIISEFILQFVSDDREIEYGCIDGHNYLDIPTKPYTQLMKRLAEQ
jgi:hypothetical protein